MIDRITLRKVLPRVFRGSESEPPVCHSEVWLREDVSFVRPSAYIVEAESGTGKSSLCSFVYGARTDYDGEILFDGEDVRGFSIERWCALRREALAYLPQEMRLFGELSVMDNIMVKNRLTSYRSESEVMGMLDRLELAHKAGEPAGRLSVGQQQRVAIVRALCQPFDFLLVDEPVSHLDVRNNATVASLIVEEATARQASVIVTSVGNKLAVNEYKLIRL
ncbi:ATP-binding cassette domain-containing protein [Duncaniella muricolitica]|uniref:ATP-binding cassette domain-containing protein n=1 Tax=Duncaniella muricolitica TaxID=2880704 RepID=UPI00244E0BFA|nr:ATP-binding cassette domain-containing protein [Duncaniella muricolitica]